MLYKVNYSEGVIEFVGNSGRAYLEAADPDGALRAARDLFSYTREEKVESLESGHYVVTFKIALDYRLSLLRSVEKSIRLLRAKDLYAEGRYIDRYIVANVYKETGKPAFLDGVDIKEEISTLRKSAVVAREVPNVMSFIDWDICIHNYLELNSKEGYVSRVVRNVKS